MWDFSIDLKAEEIYSPKTKEYFNEVLKSYHNWSYRSSVVMLYSIVICDLVYKLESSKDLYQDAVAIDIIDEINLLQQSHPNSPARENALIDMIRDRTNLFSIGEYDNIANLKLKRNLSAHPVMSSDYILFKPNKETVRSLIRNAMEAVLLKTPLNISKKIFDDFIVYVTEIKDEFTEDYWFYKHLENKYLKDMSEEVENDIFRSLWKITLKLQGPTEEENRYVNIKVLKLFLWRNSTQKISLISNDSSFYSDIPPSLLEFFLNILCFFPLIYWAVGSEIHSLLDEHIKKDANIKAKTFFMSDDLDTHIEMLLAMDPSIDEECIQKVISLETIISIYKQCCEEWKNSLWRYLLIEYFGLSASFAQADSRFDYLIEPFLSEFTETELVSLIWKIENEWQIYSRRQAGYANAKVKYQLDELNDAFDYSIYPHSFWRL